MGKYGVAVRGGYMLAMYSWVVGLFRHVGGGWGSSVRVVVVVGWLKDGLADGGWWLEGAC